MVRDAGIKYSSSVWEIDALNAARTLDIDHAEAIMRVELGSKVLEMSSKEIKRDLLLLSQ